ncbi:MAG: SRPBCC family protein [Lacipirellulaceae bacterium]
MSKLTITKHIDATPDIVFRLATDFENTANHIQGIEKVELLTHGPVQVGTRFRETRKMFGKEATEEMTVTEFVPPKRFTLETESCGCHYVCTHELIHDIAGTHFKLDIETHAVSLMAKVMSPLSKLMAGTMRKMIESDLEDLSKIAEQQAATNGIES